MPGWLASALGSVSSAAAKLPKCASNARAIGLTSRRGIAPHQLELDDLVVAQRLDPAGEKALAQPGAVAGGAVGGRVGRGEQLIGLPRLVQPPCNHSPASCVRLPGIARGAWACKCKGGWRKTIPSAPNSKKPWKARRRKKTRASASAATPAWPKRWRSWR